MRLLKPAWVTHKEGQPIFSIDIHPDGSRFATGGQGEDAAGKIIIWNMAPVREEAEEKDDTVPRILCEMDNHLACVNCVRWSGNGRHLASCGDDKLVMIWQISKYGVGSTVFGSDSKIVESWRPCHTLRGHSGDVLDLSWSPDDIWLATCSIDNTIIVWNAEKFPEQVAVLKGHTGLVKGVTWDPVGKYLASQSDDKSLRIWRTRDWQQEASVTEPFKECGGTTHVLRCDWSPDGHYLVSAHAMNNSGPTAQIVDREGWKTSLDFVGHRKAVTVVRFNPGILSKKLKKDSEKLQQYSCCAIGSRDRSLSIWLTALKRPLVVTHDLFTNSILDISWAQNGIELLCCSCDGTVAYLQFKPEEIGSALDKEDVNNLLEKIYGKRTMKNSSTNSGSQIIESADLLKLQQQQHQHQHQNGVTTSPDDKSRLSLSTPTKSSSFYKGMDISNSPFKPKDKQIETKTADGKRRITPIFISEQQDVDEGPAPFTNTINFASSKVSSTIQVEKQDKVTYSGFLSPTSSKSQPPFKPGHEGTPKSASKSPTDKTTLERQPIDPVVQRMSALDSSQEKSVVKSTETHKPSVDTGKLQSSPSEKPQDGEKHKEKIKTTNSLSLKRKHDKDKDEQPKKRGRPRITDKDRAKFTPTSTPVIPQQPIERETIRFIQSSSDLTLPVPSYQKQFNAQITKESEDEALMLEVENFVQSGSASLHKLKCTKGGNLEWEQVLSSQILAVAGSRHISCAACADTCLSVFNSIGQKVLPNLLLSSKISILDVQGYHLLAVTSIGSIYVWNIQKKTGIIKNEKLSTIMKSQDEIWRAFLTRDGVPVITLSTGKSYSYSADMGCWMIVHDRQDHVQLCSAHQNSKPRVSSAISGTLASLQLSQERNTPSTQRTFQSGQNMKQLSTINHLETQVQTCLCLKSSSEYKFWLQTYVRYLVQEGLETRLREVCSDLLGPLYKSKNSLWDCTILGFNKRDLLKELLPYFCENLKTLQRLYTEFQEQLDSVDGIS